MGLKDKKNASGRKETAVGKKTSGSGKAAPESASRKKSRRKGKAGKKRRRVLRSKLTRAEIGELFARLAAANPEPQGELEYKNPYTLLVAVALSAQATDKGVNKATRELFKIADSPQKMLELGEKGLIEHIRSIGLYRNKAKNIIAMSQMLLDEHGGEAPSSRKELEKLPGIGRKSANVVLNIAFGQPVIAVDTHIFRLCNRTGLAPGKNVREVEDLLERVVPEQYRLHAHHWLILHGRYVCKARKPDCPACIIADLCKYDEKTLAN
jgi:endonuclease-3